MRRKTIFTNQQIYHVYNRGVAKQQIFDDYNNYKHFLLTLAFYLERHPKTKLSEARKDYLKNIFNEPCKEPLVEILAYCLMPNHFHLILKQIKENGIVTFLGHCCNSYTRYFNTINERVGPIFQGRFKAVMVENDAQLFHLSRYIHLNPFVAKITKKPKDYQWSSIAYYLNDESSRICKPNDILQHFDKSEKYSDFINDFSDYLLSLEEFNALSLEQI